MMVLARQYARGLLWLTIGYFAILEAAMVAAILYWPKFRDNTPALAKLIPFQALQDLLTAVQQSGYWPYFAIQQWFKGCSLFGVAAIAFMGSGIIAREADQRTAEFLFSRPVSRRTVLRVRSLVLLLAVVLPVYLSSISAIWISPLVDERLPWRATLLASTYMACFLAMLVAATVLLSVLSTHQLRAGVIVVGIVLLSFAQYLIQGIDQWSLFATIDVWTFMKIGAGEFPLVRSGCFVAAALAMLFAAEMRLERRVW
ncbi:MAG: ABC transporter permease subunit [Pirellulales bacterium]|nr:ABC transporter permease subunit [Pirellulales bacterium]